MKPIKIKMQAFGPYIKECEVDFTLLYDSKIFLITGSTGSGKTTILDAMSFALYGTATGSLRNFNDMRNTMVSSSVPTIAEFEFSLGKDIYLFKRIKQSRLIKKRGGSVEQTFDIDAACYIKSENEWKLLKSVPKDVTAYANELLGVNGEQFSQVIVLPQGEFRKLLIAKSSEKVEILEKLFNTAKWQILCGKFNLHAKKLEEETKELLSERTLQLSNFDVLNEDEFNELKLKTQKSLDESEKSSKKLADKLNDANIELATAKQLNQKLSEIEQLKEKSTELNKKEIKIEEIKKSLELNKKANIIYPYYKIYSNNSSSHKERQKNLEEAKKNLKDINIREENLKQKVKLIPEIDRETELTSNELTEARKNLENANLKIKFEKELKDKKILSVTLETKINELILTIENNKKRIEKGQDFLKTINEKYIDKIPQYLTEVQKYEDIKKDYDKIQEAENDFKKCNEKNKNIKKEYDLFLKKYNEFRGDYLKKEQLFKKDTAYLLASELRDGERCQVCGSFNHPFKATPAAQNITFEELELIRKTYEEKQNIHMELTEKFNKSVGELKSITNSFILLKDIFSAHNITKNDLDKKYSENLLLLNEAKKNSEKKHEYENKLTQLILKKEENEKLIEEKKNEKLILEKKLSQLEGSIALQGNDNNLSPDDLEKSIRKKENILKTKKQELKLINEEKETVLTQVVKCQEAYKNCEKLFNEAIEALSSSESEFFSLCIKNNFSFSFNFEESKENEGEIKNFEKEIRDFEDEKITVKSKIKELENEVKSKDILDILKIEKNIESLNLSKQENDRENGMLKQRFVNIENTINKILSINKAINKIEEKSADILKLSKLLNGKNNFNTPIYQFILGITLDEIISIANVYFNKLSRGQYTLLRKDIAGGQGFKGLELFVMDAHRGADRPVSTLSGGELFIASLSLAFGLSDVVQNYTGSVKLDSIFIDEGFGTLDSETLEAAMNAFNDIRKSGRLIGIISHVDGLKERIASKIEVFSQVGSGSSITVKSI